MSDLTKDNYMEAVGFQVMSDFVNTAAAITYYQWSIVYILAAGAVSKTPVATSRALGISPKKQVVASGGSVEVIIFGHIWMPLGASITAADEGDPLVLNIGTTATDNVADYQSAKPEGALIIAADDIFLGRILRAKSNRMLVAINHGMSGHLGAATPTNAWG
jgi:hypothetical protein